MNRELMAEVNRVPDVAPATAALSTSRRARVGRGSRLQREV